MNFRRQRTAFGNICAHRLHTHNAAMEEQVLEICFATWRAQRSDAVGKRRLKSGQEEAEAELKRRYAELKAHEDELRRRLALLRTDEAQLEKRRVEIEELAVLSQSIASVSLVQANEESGAPHSLIGPKLESGKGAESQRPPDGNTHPHTHTHTQYKSDMIYVHKSKRSSAHTHVKMHTSTHRNRTRIEIVGSEGRLGACDQ